MSLLSGVRIDAPSVIDSGETATIRLTILDADVSLPDIEVRVIAPGENEVDKTSSLVDVSATLTVAGVTSYELDYKFSSGNGVYLFVVVDTSVGGKSFCAATHCLALADMIINTKSITDLVKGDTSLLLSETDAIKADTESVLLNLSTSMTPGSMRSGLPAFVGKGESAVLRLWWATSSTGLSNVSVYVVPPTGGVIDITNRFVYNPSASIAGAVVQFDGKYLFRSEGGYAFVIVDENTTPKNIYLGYSYCAPWTTRIDQPISDLNKQRADLQRVFGRLNRG